MFKNLKIKTEGIMFQPNSKFSQELIAIIKELKAYPETLAGRGITDFTRVYLETMSFFEKTISKKLSDCIYNHTGINVEKVYCRELYGNTPYASGMFFTMTVYPDRKNVVNTKWMLNIKDVLTGGATKEYKITPETSDEFNKLLANFDDKIGRFKNADEIRDLITIRLGFDMGCVVFTDKIIHEKIEPLTAEETAAILLHEIGHTIAEVSYLKYCHFSIDVLTKAFEHFNDYAPIEEKIKFLKTSPILNHPEVEKLHKNDVLFQSIKKVIDKIDIPSQDSSSVLTGIVVLRNLASLIFGLVARLIVIPLYLLLKYVCYHFDASEYKGSDKNPKISDYKLFNIQSYEEERIADEYVTKHNMGSYLQSSFFKLNDLMLYVNGSEGLAGIGYSNKGSAIFHLTTFLGGIDLLFSAPFTKALSTHPETKERFEMIAAAQIRNIKKLSDNPALLKLALAEYEKCHNNVLAPDKLKKTEAMITKMSDIVNNIVAIVSFGLISVDHQEQLNKLMHQALMLMDNDMFASVAKLKLMLKEK